MKKVLFVCIHNSARSQMAEAFCNMVSGGSLVAQSAGIEAGKLNMTVVKVMAEVGIDLSSNKTKSAQALIDAGEEFDYIITVCDENGAERCPVFPTSGERYHFGFEDPSALLGSEEERLEGTREIRDQIKIKIVEWVKDGIILH